MLYYVCGLFPVFCLYDPDLFVQLVEDKNNSTCSNYYISSTNDISPAGPNVNNWSNILWNCFNILNKFSPGGELSS